jgi:hypothetical protein
MIRKASYYKLRLLSAKTKATQSHLAQKALGA